MKKNKTFVKGRIGEEFAVHELMRRGIRTIARNFRSEEGEIDLIGTEAETLVFVEVKNWTVQGIEDLGRAINSKKRRRIVETAKFFCQKYRQYSGMAIRFDILFISKDAVKHIASAWSEQV
ncbi:MAG: YraN family protein [Spirochaetaceae bacterium]|nr:YraN family protein [Spirochaetaceae bacterium]GMO29535.1 MAG: YraN family protein [Termitinemataceae bacterium]